MSGGAGAGVTGEAGRGRQPSQPAGQLVPRPAGRAAQHREPAVLSGEPVARPGAPAAAAPPGLRHRQIALVDLLDRVLAGGVVVTGEIRLAIADVDLVTISLRALVSSVSTAVRHPGPAGKPGSGEQAGDW